MSDCRQPPILAHPIRRLAGSCGAALAALTVAVLPTIAEPLTAFEDGTMVHTLEVPREDGSAIEAYVLVPQGEEPSAKPVFLLLQGSGCNSVFARGEGGVSVPFLFVELRRHARDLNVVLIEKRGVAFGDNAGNSGKARCSDEYVEHATRDGRVDDAVAVIDYLTAEGLHDGSRLVVIGHSEGSDVAPGVALASPRVTHLALLGFSATHNVLDVKKNDLVRELQTLIRDRDRPRSGAISAEEFRERFGELVEKLREFHGNPDGLDGFQDHTYRRWSSYVSGQVLDDLLRVDLPIFLGIASEDTKAPTFGADLVVTELLRRGKRNLTHLNYVGYDHGFGSGEGDKAELRHDQVLKDVMRWVKQSSP